MPDIESIYTWNSVKMDNMCVYLLSPPCRIDRVDLRTTYGGYSIGGYFRQLFKVPYS